MSTQIIDFSQSIARAVEAAGPSVVGVGRAGSGVIVADGFVATNAHNIHEDVGVHFDDGTTVAARPAGVDIDGDLAVLAVATGNRPALALEPQGAPSLGHLVIGLSRPGGRTLRAGVGFVSGNGISFGGPRGHVVTGAIEHSAAMPHGSSGGPLLDTNGHVVGINTHREGEGLYLALPVTAELKARIDALSRGEVLQRPRLGVALASPRAARHLRQAVGLPPRDGLLVQSVAEGAPADRGGVRRGDLIISVGGRPTTTLEDLAQALEAAAPEGSAQLGIVRGSDELTLSVSFSRPEGDK
jgi:serine protease Do